MAAGDGFTGAERHEIDRTIRAAEESCRYEFSVYVGAAEGDPRAFAERLHSALVLPDRSVLILLDSAQRALEVVTGPAVRRTLTDREVELSIVSMQSAFAEGDLVGGLTRGILQLAEHARR